VGMVLFFSAGVRCRLQKKPAVRRDPVREMETSPPASRPLEQKTTTTTIHHQMMFQLYFCYEGVGVGDDMDWSMRVKAKIEKM
jgi:hypothetical protein